MNVLHGYLKPIESTSLRKNKTESVPAYDESVKQTYLYICILTSGTWTSFKNLAARFSRTIPSDAAKKARTWLIKCFSESDSFSQCCTSVERSTSSAAKPIHSKVKQPEFDDHDDDTTRNRAITHTHTHKT